MKGEGTVDRAREKHEKKAKIHHHGCGVLRSFVLLVPVPYRYTRHRYTLYLLTVPPTELVVRYRYSTVARRAA